MFLITLTTLEMQPYPVGLSPSYVLQVRTADVKRDVSPRRAMHRVHCPGISSRPIVPVENNSDTNTATAPSLRTHEGMRVSPVKSIPNETSRRTLRGVPAATWDRAIPFRAHWTTGAVTGSSINTFNRWKYCTAANFPEMEFARLRFDTQYHEANSMPRPFYSPNH